MTEKLDAIIFGFTQALPLNVHGSLLAFHAWLGHTSLPYTYLGQISCGALVGSMIFWVLHKGQNIFGPKHVNFLPFIASSLFPLIIILAWAIPRWGQSSAPFHLLLIGHGVGLLATLVLFKKFSEKKWEASTLNGLILGGLQSLMVIPGCDRQSLAMLYFKAFGYDLKTTLLLSLWSLFPLLAFSALFTFFIYPLPPLDIFLTNVIGAGLASYFALDIFWRLSDKVALTFIIICRLGVLGFALSLA